MAIEHQAHHYLLAVEVLIARVAALGLPIARGQTHEIGRGEIIEQERVVEIKQVLFACGPRPFDLLRARMELIEVGVKRGFAQRTEVAVHDLLQRAAANPVGHRILRAWGVIALAMSNATPLP